MCELAWSGYGLWAGKAHDGRAYREGEHPAQETDELRIPQLSTVRTWTGDSARRRTFGAAVTTDMSRRETLA